MLTGAIPLMSKALRGRGIDDLTTLDGPSATRDGILDALGRLRDTSEQGDLVVVYYTGHGAQISDDDQDELDGLDEAWIAVGAVDTLDPASSDAELGVIRDDDIGELVDGIAAAVGPQGHVLVVIDACHSGSGTRGQAADMLIGRTFGSPSGQETGSGWAGPLGDNLVVVSAARHDQTATWTSTEQAGVLTGLMAPMLAQAKPDQSYRALQLRLREELGRAGHGQEPQVEGAADTTVLSGRGTQQPYFEVARRSGDRVHLRGGTLGGLTVGTKISLFPPGTREPHGEPLAVGVVVDAGLAGAEVELDGPAPATDAWALVTEPGPPSLLRWTLDPSAEKLATELRGYLGEVPGLVESESGPWTLTVTGGGKHRRLTAVHDEGTRLDGPLLKAPDEEGWRTLQRAMGRAAAHAMLRDATLTDPNYELVIRLRTPVLDTTAGTCKVTAVTRPSFEEAERSLFVGDAAVVEVLFEGARAAHLTIVVFTPEGEAVPLYPPPGASNAAGELPLVGSFLVDPTECRAFDSPGIYVFKAWATAEPMKLEWLRALHPAGASRGGSLPDLHLLSGRTAVHVVHVGD